MPPKPSFAAALLTWLALPVYVWQGLGVRLLDSVASQVDGLQDGREDEE